MAYKFQLGTAKLSGSIIPTDDDALDLGEAGKEFKDLFIDGTAHLDAINFNGTAISATATELNKLASCNVSTAELNKLAGSDSNSAANKMIILDANGDFEMQDNDKIHFGDGADANIHWDGDSLEIGNADININIGGTTSEVTFGDNVTVTGDLTVNGTTTTINATNIEITGALKFEGNIPDGNETLLSVVNPTADRTINLADAGGTLVPFAADPGAGAQITSTPTELNLLDAITRGSIVYGNASGVSARLAKGSANTVLSSDGTDISYTQVTNAMLAGSIVDSKLNTISTAGKVNLTALEIDGHGTSVTSLADVDLFIVDDGAGGTNKKMAASVLKNYIGSGTLNIYQLSGSGTVDGIIGAASGSGYYYNEAVTSEQNGLAYESVYMISGSGWNAGDMIRIKAPPFASGGKISIYAQSSSAGDFAHSIELIQSDTSGSNMSELGTDAEDEPAIVLESNNAAVSLIMWAKNEEGDLTTFNWAIV